MTWEVWAAIAVVFVVIGVWWVKRAIDGVKRAIDVRDAIRDEVRRRATEGKTDGGNPG
jgi:hypothetical protein